jgi:hypothetical protein
MTQMTRIRGETFQGGSIVVLTRNDLPRHLCHL